MTTLGDLRKLDLPDDTPIVVDTVPHGNLYYRNAKVEIKIASDNTMGNWFVVLQKDRRPDDF